jgi:hypothetical protein
MILDDHPYLPDITVPAARQQAGPGVGWVSWPVRVT